MSVDDIQRNTNVILLQMANLDHLWERCLAIFPILENIWDEELPIMHRDDYNYITNELIRLDIVEHMLETIWLNLDNVLRQKIVPSFWRHFNDYNDYDTEDSFYLFKSSVYELYKEFKKFDWLLTQLKPLAYRCKKKYNIETFKTMLKTILLSQLPTNFTKIVHSFYQISFNVFANRHGVFDPETCDDLKCIGCNKEMDNCLCDDLIVDFNRTNQYLYTMDLLDRLAGFTLTNLIQERIDTHVQDTCRGSLDTSHIKDLIDWLNSVVIAWLSCIYNQKHSILLIGNPRIIPAKVLNDFRIKLEYYLYDTYAHIIIDQFFTIIVDFPDSKAAVDDLKICLDKIDLRTFLVKKVKDELEKRLLHPGVNTKDILSGYVAAIKAIRHLDDTGVLLETISEPVKQYMRSRPDTVRCVVWSLTEDSPTYLAEELAQTKEYTDCEAGMITGWERWMPDPIDATSKQQKPVDRSPDIISMVVDIYGSKDIFVNEYKNLLADRLLAQLDFDPSRELANLEHLKLRFDESMLHTCDVMLKDITDSKRTNCHIHSVLASNASNSPPFQLSALILSSQFWPPFKSTYTPELPDEFKEVFDIFTKQYEEYKGNRSLVWRLSLGHVDVEIEFGNKRMDLKVSTIQALIIYAFQGQSKWRLEELSQKLCVPTSVVRKRIGFWITKRVIEETECDVFELANTSSSSSSGMDNAGYQPQHNYQHEIDDDEHESAMASATDQREEELQVFWSYIVGMLTNLDSMPLERIHQMLRMFASHGPGVEFSQEELKNFLQRKVREHALVFTAGVYQLPK